MHASVAARADDLAPYALPPHASGAEVDGGAPHAAAILYGMEEPKYRVRASYTADTITVYQAYAPEIGLAAARDGRFPAAWKRDRMTWIKPSFGYSRWRIAPCNSDSHTKSMP